MHQYFHMQKKPGLALDGQIKHEDTYLASSTMYAGYTVYLQLQWSQGLLTCIIKCTEIFLVCMSIVCLWVWKKSRRSVRTWVLWYTTVSKCGALWLSEGMTMFVLCAVNVLCYKDGSLWVWCLRLCGTLYSSLTMPAQVSLGPSAISLDCTF